jgi:hypothetical protein
MFNVSTGFLAISNSLLRDNRIMLVWDPCLDDMAYTTCADLIIPLSVGLALAEVKDFIDSRSSTSGQP